MMIQIGSFWFAKHDEHHAINSTCSLNANDVHIPMNDDLLKNHRVGINAVNTNNCEKQMVAITSLISKKSEALKKAENNKINKSDTVKFFTKSNYETVKLHKCSICNLIFHKQSDAYSHLFDIHKRYDVKSLIEDIVAKKIKNPKTAEPNRIENLNSIACYDCLICNKTFMFRENLENHLMQDHLIMAGFKNFFKERIVYPKKIIKTIRRTTIDDFTNLNNNKKKSIPKTGAMENNVESIALPPKPITVNELSPAEAVDLLSVNPLCPGQSNCDKNSVINSTSTGVTVTTDSQPSIEEKTDQMTFESDPVESVQANSMDLVSSIKKEIEMDEPAPSQLIAESNPVKLENINDSDDSIIISENISPVRNLRKRNQPKRIEFRQSKIIKKEIICNEEQMVSNLSKICILCNENVNSNEYSNHIKNIHKEYNPKLKLKNLTNDEINVIKNQHSKTMKCINIDSITSSEVNYITNESYQCLVCGEILPNLLESQNHVDDLHDCFGQYENVIKKIMETGSFNEGEGIRDSSNEFHQQLNSLNKKEIDECMDVVSNEKPLENISNSIVEDEFTEISNRIPNEIINSKYKKPHQCEICQKIISNLWNAYTHAFVQHEEISNFTSCIQLYNGDPKLIDYDEQYKLYRKDHENVARRYKCIKCDILLSQKRSTFKHCNKFHPESDQSELFEEFEIFLNDLNQINSNIDDCKKPHQCTICNNVFCDLWNALAHVRCNHKNWPNFESHVKLFDGVITGFPKRYLAVKKDNIKYKCKLCSKIFQISNATRHVRAVHRGVNPTNMLEKITTISENS